MARFDLLRAVCHLACYITKWSTDCDKRLHRLACYIHSTKHFRMIGWVGDDLSSLQPHMFADADFAGCTSSQRSTSGLHITVRGPNSCFPIVGCSKRQGCVSISTPEAEIVAGSFALQVHGLPALDLWQTVLPHKPALVFHEDNQAMIAVCRSGRNPTMRYLGRTHRVRVSWLHEVCKGKDVDLIYTKSESMAADVYTKAFTEITRWRHACMLINIMDPASLKDKKFMESLRSSRSGGSSSSPDPGGASTAGVGVPKKQKTLKAQHLLLLT